MNLLPRWMWMTTEAMRHQEATEREIDPGDMGTAFGLDATIAATDEPTSGSNGPATPWQERLDRRPRR
jgi:hypothetical protein